MPSFPPFQSQRRVSLSRLGLAVLVSGLVFCLACQRDESESLGLLLRTPFADTLDGSGLKSDRLRKVGTVGEFLTRQFPPSCRWSWAEKGSRHLFRCRDDEGQIAFERDAQGRFRYLEAFPLRSTFWGLPPQVKPSLAPVSVWTEAPSADTLRVNLCLENVTQEPLERLSLQAWAQVGPQKPVRVDLRGSSSLLAPSDWRCVQASFQDLPASSSSNPLHLSFSAMIEQNGQIHVQAFPSWELERSASLGALVSLRVVLEGKGGRPVFGRAHYLKDDKLEVTTEAGQMWVPQSKILAAYSFPWSAELEAQRDAWHAVLTASFPTDGARMELLAAEMPSSDQVRLVVAISHQGTWTIHTPSLSRADTHAGWQVDRSLAE